MKSDIQPKKQLDNSKLFHLYNYKNEMVYVYLFVIKSCKRY